MNDTSFLFHSLTRNDLYAVRAGEKGDNRMKVCERRAAQMSVIKVHVGGKFATKVTRCANMQNIFLRMRYKEFVPAFFERILVKQILRVTSMFPSQEP